MAETVAPTPDGRGKVPAYTEDPWTRVVSLHGIAGDELRSALQKSIRRGLLENALLVGYELFQSGPEAECLLWERLQIISVEDVGFGRPDAPVLLDALFRMHTQFPWPAGDRFIFAAHGSGSLSQAPRTARPTSSPTGQLTWPTMRASVLKYPMSHSTSTRGAASSWVEG